MTIHTGRFKPSLTEYSDIFGGLSEVAEEIKGASGIDQRYLAELDDVLYEADQARDSALADRTRINNDKTLKVGTDFWQANNVEPFVQASTRARRLLSDQEFIAQVEASTKPAPSHPTASPYEPKFQAYSLKEIGRKLDNCAEREQLKVREPQQGTSRQLGRDSLDFDRNPFVKRPF